MCDAAQGQEMRFGPLVLVRGMPLRTKDGQVETATRVCRISGVDDGALERLQDILF
jgi:hypothetical protein